MHTLKETITWYDVASLTEKDLRFIEERFKPHQVILEELKSPSAREKVEVYGDFLYLVLHLPLFDVEKKTSLPVEIDILAKADEVVTVHYGDIEFIGELQKKCETLPGFRNIFLGQSTAEFLYYLIEHLFDFAQRQLRHINDKVTLIEEAVFSGREKEIIRTISEVKRDILDFRRTLRPLHGTLESLERRGMAFYGTTKSAYFSDLTGDYLRLWNLAENYKDTIESLETTNQTLLSSKISEVMQVVSVLVFLIAPFTVIGSLFEINTQYAPIIGSPYDWWIISSSMVLGSVALYVYFKKRRWL